MNKIKFLLLSAMITIPFLGCKKEFHPTIQELEVSYLTSENNLPPSNHSFYSNDYSFNNHLCLTGNDIDPHVFNIMQRFGYLNEYGLNLYEKIFGRPIWSLYLEASNNVETTTIVPLIDNTNSVKSILVWQWDNAQTNYVTLYRKKDIQSLIDYGTGAYDDDDIDILESTLQMILFCESLLFCSEFVPQEGSDHIKPRTDKSEPINFVRTQINCPTCPAVAAPHSIFPPGQPQYITFRNNRNCKTKAGGGGILIPGIDYGSFGPNVTSIDYQPGGNPNGNGSSGGNNPPPGINDNLDPTEIDQFLGQLFRFIAENDLIGQITEDELFEIISQNCVKDGRVDTECASNAIFNHINKDLDLDDNEECLKENLEQMVAINNFMNSHSSGDECEINLSKVVGNAFADQLCNGGTPNLDLGNPGDPLSDIMKEQLWELAKGVLADIVPGGTFLTVGPELFENLQGGNWMDAMYNALDIALNEADACFPAAKVAGAAVGLVVSAKDLQKMYDTFKKLTSFGDDIVKNLYSVLKDKFGDDIFKKISWSKEGATTNGAGDGTDVFESLLNLFGGTMDDVSTGNGNELIYDFSLGGTRFELKYHLSTSTGCWTVTLSKGSLKFKMRFCP